jgi:hypothetical protein
MSRYDTGRPTATRMQASRSTIRLPKRGVVLLAALTLNACASNRGIDDRGRAGGAGVEPTVVTAATLQQHSDRVSVLEARIQRFDSLIRKSERQRYRDPKGWRRVRWKRLSATSERELRQVRDQIALYERGRDGQSGPAPGS